MNAFDESEIAEALQVIQSEGRASVSLIQRRLKLGYTKAVALMDELERRGHVGPAKGTEPRDILTPAVKPPKKGAPESAKMLEAAMKGNQMPATATEQAIGGRMANPTPKPDPNAGASPEKPKKPAKAKKLDIRPIPENIHVRHEFAEGEFATMAKQLGVQHSEMERLEEEKKTFNSDIKAKMDRVQAEINRLTGAVNSGFVMNEVRTLPLIAIDHATKKAQKCWYNAQTGELVKTEDFELNGQMDIFALHPKPKNIKAKLPPAMLKSVV